MDRKAEALARVRRARLNATTLCSDLANIGYHLCKLEYWDEDILMTDATNVLKCTIHDLFELEGKLSGS